MVRFSTWSLFDTILSHGCHCNSLEILKDWPDANCILHGQRSPLWMLMMQKHTKKNPGRCSLSCRLEGVMFKGCFTAHWFTSRLWTVSHNFWQEPLAYEIWKSAPDQFHQYHLQLTVFFIAVGALKDEQLKIQALQSFTVLFGATLRDHDHGQRDGTHFETYVSCGTFRSTRHLDGCLLRISEKNTLHENRPNPQSGNFIFQPFIFRCVCCWFQGGLDLSFQVWKWTNCCFLFCFFFCVLFCVHSTLWVFFDDLQRTIPIFFMGFCWGSNRWNPPHCSSTPLFGIRIDQNWNTANILRS